MVTVKTGLPIVDSRPSHVRWLVLVVFNLLLDDKLCRSVCSFTSWPVPRRMNWLSLGKLCYFVFLQLLWKTAGGRLRVGVRRESLIHSGDRDWWMVRLCLWPGHGSSPMFVCFVPVAPVVGSVDTWRRWRINLHSVFCLLFNVIHN